MFEDDGMVAEVYEAMEEVIDPELHIDVVNLGLVYGVELDEELNCVVTMTMTSMGCPSTGQIVADVKYAIRSNLDDIGMIDVDVVWTPPWTKDKMSRYAKMALGVHD